MRRNLPGSLLPGAYTVTIMKKVLQGALEENDLGALFCGVGPKNQSGLQNLQALTAEIAESVRPAE